MCSHLTSSHHCVPTHLEDEQLAPGNLRELRHGLDRGGAGADDADAEEIEMLRGLGSQAVHAVLGKVHGLAEMIGVPGRASEDLLIGAIGALKP